MYLLTNPSLLPKFSIFKIFTIFVVFVNMMGPCGSENFKTMLHSVMVWFQLNQTLL